MPVNHSIFEPRLNTCNKELQALFDGLEIGEKLQQKIDAVKNYYNLSYTKAISAKKVEDIVQSYELFIRELTNVKNGKLKPKEALDKIGSACESRKISVLFHNLAKACELMFYAATAFSLWAGIFGIALPVLIVQPVLGVAVGITVVGGMLAAAYKALSCFTEFRSISRHDAEYTNEKDLISYFFKPPVQPKETLNPIDKNAGLEFSCC
ncbi:Uncharacterised protein [Legionella steigerwaltii]|uniref:DUF5638 domain-containing protein n=1 Tax=Legionella steigerwaltii TaxID=460 RepID=A0A378L7A6_9GAMM|nr:DUF5638 domain-containing protein [Legionella steigerwaltii]KTD77360.1 hypothetical protein Lstg_1717 [Legionella steigerwaltii]STY22240.1 Uncharacterised protein [Legionella steigerwaltii]